MNRFRLICLVGLIALPAVAFAASGQPVIVNLFVSGPTITMSATPATIVSGQTTTISWSITGGATSCTGSGGDIGWQNASSTELINDTSYVTETLTQSITYVLSCTNSQGGGRGSVTVTVTPPNSVPPTPSSTPPLPYPVTYPSAGGSSGVVSPYAQLQNISDVQYKYQGNSVFISWQNPDSVLFAGVRIVRSPYGFPADPLDGKVIYQGPGTYVRDVSGVPGIMYYYAAFAYDAKNNYSSGTLFSIPWPCATSANQTTKNNSGQFPGGSSLIASGENGGCQNPTAPSQNFGTSLLPPPAGFSFSSIIFAQAGRTIAPVGTSIPVNGSLPLLVIVPDTVLAKNMPTAGQGSDFGLSRVTITINNLGRIETYLLRQSPTDQQLESLIDLSDFSSGGYPFVVEFWPDSGEPFAFSGILDVNQQPLSMLFSGGFFGQTLWSLLALFLCFVVFIFLVYSARRDRK